MSKLLDNTIIKENKAFIDDVLKTGNIEQSARNIQASTRGSNIIRRKSVAQEIAKRQRIMNANATLGATRIREIIESGKEHNALQASIYAINKVDGMPIQQIESKNQSISFTIDLSGK